MSFEANKRSKNIRYELSSTVIASPPIRLVRGGKTGNLRLIYSERKGCSWTSVLEIVWPLFWFSAGKNHGKADQGKFIIPRQPLQDRQGQ